VRNRAKELAELLSDSDKIRAERRKSKQTKSKYTGVGSDESGFGGTGKKYGGFGSEDLSYGSYSGQVYGMVGGSLRLGIPGGVISKIDLPEVHNMRNMMNSMMVELDQLFNEVLFLGSRLQGRRIRNLLPRKPICSILMMMFPLHQVLRMERARKLIRVRH
jgi:hypothetical protein